jgi:hypothetical protein
MPDPRLVDPSEIYTSLKSAWKSFKSKVTNLTIDAVKSVEVWRDAESLILPVHPFSQSIDTTRTDGIWRDRTSLFVPEVKNLNNRIRHGFNKSGQIVIAERKHFSIVVIQGDGYFDVAGVWPESNGTYSVMPSRPHYVRYNLDAQTRVVSIWDYSPTEEDNLQIELFDYKNDRLDQTHLLWFDSGKGLADWMEDLPLEEQATLYRQVNKNYREYLPRRAIRRFNYDKAGTLENVDSNQLHLPDHVEVIYARSQGSTLEETFNKLVPLLTKEILAAVKKAKKSHPLRSVVLLYSAEHVHTGLPYALATVPVDAQLFEATDIEAYSVPVEWPMPKPGLQKAINQFIIAVESSPEYRNSDAPQAYRELLWRVSLNIAKELLASKIANNQLTVLPIDDHGDIDPRKDFLDCVSKADRKYFPLLDKPS